MDATAADADPSDYDGLVLPGGVASPDNLRTHEDAVAFTRAFSGRAIAPAAFLDAVTPLG